MSGVISLAIIIALGIASALSSKDECCREEDSECRTVAKLKDEIAKELIGKYGLSEEEAEEIADDLLSADEERAETAAKRLREIGAIDDVLAIMSETIK